MTDTHLQILPRKVAQERGIKFYFTGRPCLRGHLALRRTPDKRCRVCDLEKAKLRYATNLVSQGRTREASKRASAAATAGRRKARELLAADEAYQRKCSVEREVRAQARRDRDSAQKAHRYATDEEYRARVNERNKAWSSDNPAKANARVTRRRLEKISRTPPWLTDGMRADIDRIYEESRRLTKETGIPHEVDHVVPLQGTKVCGLHVPWNLEVVTKALNRSKHNKFDPSTSKSLLESAAPRRSLADLGAALA